MTKERWQKIFKTIRISITAILVIIICLKVSQPSPATQLSPASQPKSPTYTTGEGFGVSGMVDHANEVADAQVEASIAKYSEDINWEYGDPSLYYEDFSDIEMALDERATTRIETYFESKVNFPFYFITRNRYYLPVLKEIRDGNLSVDEALDDPTRSIRFSSYDMYYWVTDKVDEDFSYNEIFNEFRLSQIALGEKHFFYRFYGVTDDRPNLKEIEKSKNSENPTQYLLDSGAKIFTTNRTDGQGGEFCYYDDKGIGAHLEERYNEKFKPAEYEYDFKEPYGKFYYPVSDPSLKFAATKYGDLYLTVSAQRAMYEEIDKIIEEEGYGGQIAHMSIPRTTGLTYSQIEKGYDMSQKYNNRTIINEVYDGGYDTSLLLLLEEGEEADYAKLQQISARIQGLFYTSIFEDEKIWQRSDLFIYFYTLPKIEHKIVVDLFERDMITETFFRGMTKSIGDIYVNMYIVRVETEGFHYLDARANKWDFLLLPYKSGEEIMNWSVDDFKEHFKGTSLFF